MVFAMRCTVYDRHMSAYTLCALRMQSDRIATTTTRHSTGVCDELLVHFSVVTHTHWLNVHFLLFRRLSWSVCIAHTHIHKRLNAMLENKREQKNAVLDAHAHALAHSSSSSSGVNQPTAMRILVCCSSILSMLANETQSLTCANMTERAHHRTSASTHHPTYYNLSISSWWSTVLPASKHRRAERERDREKKKNIPVRLSMCADSSLAFGSCLLPFATTTQRSWAQVAASCCW